jgi:3-hydroxyisobutyrate dehydrogenase
MKVAVLGTGLMGSAISQRLLQQDHQVAVWNRTKSKALALEESGARVAESPQSAMAGCDVVLLVLRDAAAIDQVMFTAAGTSAAAGRTIVQMGTISPQESIQLASRFEAASSDYLACPMLGSTPEAHDGELLLMAAGERHLFDRLLPLLAALGDSPHYVGEIGKAAALKLALNQLLVGMVATFALSVGMVLRAGVSIEQFMDIVRDSSLRSPQYDKKLPRMLSRDFADPHFPVSHMLKDINLIVGEAEREGLHADVALAVRSVLQRTLDAGYIDVDYSALYNGVNPTA